MVSRQSSVGNAQLPTRVQARPAAPGMLFSPRQHSTRSSCLEVSQGNGSATPRSSSAGAPSVSIATRCHHLPGKGYSKPMASNVGITSPRAGIAPLTETAEAMYRVSTPVESGSLQHSDRSIQLTRVRRAHPESRLRAFARIRSHTRALCLANWSPVMRWDGGTATLS